MAAEPWRSYRQYLAERFPSHLRVHKVPLSLGVTCPNRDGTKALGGCTFCDNHSFSPAIGEPPRDWVEQLEKGIARLGSRHAQSGVLAYFQPHTNTYVEPERLLAACAAVMQHPRVVGIALGTRPDCLGPQIRRALAQVAAQCPLILEVGLQTSHDRTLQAINRGHTRAEFSEAMAQCAHLGADLVTHLILGLPGETPDDWVATAQYIAPFPLQAVKVHPLHIVRGTVMAAQYEGGEFCLPSLETYVEGVVRVLEHLPAAMAIERFTGDVLDGSLVAPEWSGQRERILSGVRAAFQRRGTRQGSARPLPEPH